MNGYVDHVFREQILSNSILDRSNTKEKKEEMVSKKDLCDFQEETFGSELKTKNAHVAELAN